MTDIAKILAMDECKHLEWVKEEGLISGADYKYYLEGGIPTRMILAALAFRLRDEVCGEVVHFLDRFGFEMCLREIYENCKGKHNEFLIWLICEAQPIHWILAAIRAKE